MTCIWWTVPRSGWHHYDARRDDRLIEMHVDLQSPEDLSGDASRAILVHVVARRGRLQTLPNSARVRMASTAERSRFLRQNALES